MRRDSFLFWPILKNAVNSAIAPQDGFFPIEVVFDLSDKTNLWVNPIFNLMVLPGGETATVDIRNVTFRGCNPAAPINAVLCDSNGCM